MIVQCPACNSRYRIRDDNIPPSGGKIRCPSCGHSFVVYPEAAEPAEAEDRTSITDQQALNQLVNSMAGQKPPADEHQATEIVSGGALDKLRNVPALDDLGVGDGTVEIQNPMEYWKQLQADAQVGGNEAPPSAYVGSPDEDEYDSAPTEIVSAANLSLPNMVGQPEKTRPELAVPSIPAPYVPPTAPKSVPDPFAAATVQNTPSPVPNLPPPQAQYQQPEPVRANAFGDSNLGFGSAPSEPGLFQPSGASSEDIMAAIEEASQAHLDEPGFGRPPGMMQDDAAFAPKPDPDHDGPWKLKTNFGLTYEFPDTKSLSNWLSSREELDGYLLSGDEQNFFGLSEFPQINRSSARAPSQSIASSGLNAAPSALPAMPGYETPGGFGGTPPGGGFTQPAGGFTPPPSGSGQFQAQPMPGQQAGQKVSNEFRPPSREAKWNGVLWGVFFLLLMICVVVALQTFEVFDFVGLVKGQQDQPVKTKPETPQPKVEAPKVEEAPKVDSDQEEVERLIKEARREFAGNRLQDALDRLNTIQMLAPDNADAWELSAQVYEKLGQEEKAAAALKRVESIRGTDTDAGVAEEPTE